MNITIYDYASSPIRHAASKLSEYTGITVGAEKKENNDIKIELNPGCNSAIGQQGYIIRSTEHSGILITGNHDEGITNGIYTMIRTLMVENNKDPFSRKWDIAEKPFFFVRNIDIAPYRFGGSFGYAVLSPDRWSVKEWMEYIDFIRLCNMTSITLNPAGRLYYPDYLQTVREKWRYDVWRDVIQYCHQVGLKVNILALSGMVPQEAYWENPDLRATGQEAGGYFGCGLKWTVAKKLILDIFGYSLKYLRGLDGLEMIYSEAGFSFDEETSADPAGYFADITNSYGDLLKETGSHGEYFFWNWVFDLWSAVVLPEALLKKYPKYRTLLDDLIPLLSRDISWIDASMLSVIQMFGPEIQARGNPPLREGMLLGKEKGFKSVINCFWYMNPEYALNMLPHPYIKRGIQEALYSRDELKCDGVVGYRLAPACKFLEDYTYFRLASDPSLSQEQLVEEMAGILCKNAKNQKTLKSAINMLEEFWTTHDPDTIEKAEQSFNNAFSGETSKTLENIKNGTTFLKYIVKLSQAGVKESKKNELKRELYTVLKSMYIFQGITSDICWQPESVAHFTGLANQMVRQYNWYKTSRPDIVDREIYPDASSKFSTLNWPEKNMKSDNARKGFFGEMPGPLTID